MHEHSELMKGTKHLGAALAITASFFIVELVGGILTNSLALLTDAWHMLNDILALIFAVLAAWLAQRPADLKKTYGYYRAEILAGFLNGILLWVIVVFIFYEAIQRFQHPALVESLNMLVIAFFGLAANGLSAATLSRVRHESLNVRGAFLHVLADILGSVAAICAGLIIYFWGWYQADPLISMIIGGLILYSSGRLVRDSLNILLEGVPSHIDITYLKQRLAELKGVKEVHDLHVWCISTNRMHCFSAHVVQEKGTDRKKLLSTIIRILKEDFGIDHTTIQLEDEVYPKAFSEH